jgi:hypothetical protein
MFLAKLFSFNSNTALEQHDPMLFADWQSRYRSQGKSCTFETTKAHEYLAAVSKLSGNVITRLRQCENFTHVSFLKQFSNSPNILQVTKL